MLTGVAGGTRVGVSLTDPLGGLFAATPEVSSDSIHTCDGGPLSIDDSLFVLLQSRAGD
ncbi:hypothetical protein FAIPA1_40070 [Frankia sp. AiPs1]